MRSLSAVLALSISATSLVLAGAHDASACGGCFGPPPIQETEGTVVTGHRMILSISSDRTTLYDQIKYVGAPSSFGWVLPIKGIADIGLSSDALFANLESLTDVTVSSPIINCPPCNSSGFSASSTGDFGGGDAGVIVTASEVVGPYQTVQLHSTDPNALKQWLFDNSYSIPNDVYPIIDAYVAEGFDFLAMKLIPNADVSAMRPVRVTTQGATPVLPLRMVAAGTGPKTAIKLWVMGEGRYDSANLPSFVINEGQIVWDWDTQSSNYAQLREAAFNLSNHTALLIEAAEPFSKYPISNAVMSLAMYDPLNSGYADDQGMGAELAAQEDLDFLFGDVPDNTLWVTRFYGDLSRPALASDLQLKASLNQSIVDRLLIASQTIGNAPTCPPAPSCGGPVGSSSGGQGQGGEGGSGGSGPSCSVSDDHDLTPFVGGVALLVAAGAIRRRRRA